MYTQYWGLREKPFETTPDPKFLYKSRSHEEALLRLYYTVREKKGAMLLTGGYGCGKTVLSRAFLSELMNEAKYEIALITNPRYSANQLLEEIIYQLGGDDRHNKAKGKLIRVFNDIVYANLKIGKETVIVIDEAQAIKYVETFEEIRLLLNFQQNDRYLITLILIGQPELRKRLDILPQLKQRLMIQYHLDKLDESESLSYIDHRLSVSGAERDIFDLEAKKCVYELSLGVPRVINGIADMALLMGYSEKKEIIESAFVKKVMGDVSRELAWSGS